MPADGTEQRPLDEVREQRRHDEAGGDAEGREDRPPYGIVMRIGGRRVHDVVVAQPDLNERVPQVEIVRKHREKDEHGVSHEPA